MKCNYFLSGFAIEIVYPLRLTISVKFVLNYNLPLSLIFYKLYNIWKSKQFSRKTKIRLYNSNVKSVLLYGSECWRVTKTNIKALSKFHYNCLGQICRIFWPNKISNMNLLDLTESVRIIDTINQKRFQ